METTTNYGLKKPAQEDFVNVEDINYNSDILDEKIAELEETAEGATVNINVVNDKIGEPTDSSVGTGGGVPQTLFAGIKGVLEWFTSYWTSARAAKIDNLDAKISTCAKASDWTSTRAGLIDTINTNAATAKTDATAAKNNTATNNTGSKTGILSQKLSYIIVNLLESTSYGLNAIKTAVSTVDGIVDSIKTYTATNNSASKTGVLSQKLSYIIASLLENSTYGLNAIKTTLNTVNTNTSRGAIRQIIYGAFSTNTDNDPITISVSLTNYKKAFVILDGQMYGTNGNLPTPYLSSISNTAIKISVKNSNYSSALTIKGSYQIVEYY